MKPQDNCYDSPVMNSVGCSNLVDCMINSMKKYKDAVAQVDYHTNDKITYNEIITKTHQAARYLHGQGIKTGDIISIYSPNNVDYPWQILAILSTGASCSLISPTTTPRELTHNLSITKPKAVISLKLNQEQLQVLQDTESVKYIWTENPPVDTPKCRPISDLTKDFSDSSTNEHNNWNGLCPAEILDPAFVLSSSGSTGLPKGVVLSHKNLVAMLPYGSSFMKNGGSALGLMPFYHAYGLGLMLMALHEGAKMVLIPKFALKLFIDVITSQKITHLHIVPSLMTTLAKSDEVTKDTLCNIQEVYTGAGAVIIRHQRALLKKLPENAKLYHSYGMTETTFVVFFGEIRFDKPGSAGQLLEGINAKIISKNGDELKGEVGELWLRGDTIMTGYLNNPEATAETLDNDKWLHTGDLAYCDNDGYFFIVDRIKEMIKYQGYQISPTEVELVLLTHKGVSQVAVVGVPHELYGEVPKAFVVRNEEVKPVTEEELQELVKAELSPYKQLRGGVAFVDSLPNSPTGKIQRKYLKNPNSK